MNATPESIRRIQKGEFSDQSPTTSGRPTQILWHSITVAIPAENTARQFTLQKTTNDATSWITEMEEFDRF